MKKILSTVLCGLLFVAGSAPAWALGPVDIDASLDLYNKYVWRGMIANPDAVLQPDLSASLLGIGVGFWGNVDLTDIHDNAWNFTEVDYTASYGLSLPLLDLAGGLIHYDFPNSEAPATTEFFVAATANVLLSPSVTYYYDFDEIDGAYLALSASHATPLTPAIDLEIGANLGIGSDGWHTGYFGVGTDPASGTGTTDLLVRAAAPIKAIPIVTITPSVAYSTLLSKAKDAVKSAGGDTDAVIFGLGASVSF